MSQPIDLIKERIRRIESKLAVIVFSDRAENGQVILSPASFDFLLEVKNVDLPFLLDTIKINSQKTKREILNDMLKELDK